MACHTVAVEVEAHGAVVVDVDDVIERRVEGERKEERPEWSMVEFRPMR